MQHHKDTVRKLVKFFDDLIEQLKQRDMTITIGDKRSAEDLGTVHLVVCATPSDNPSGISGTYEITRKPVHGTGEMFELFGFTPVPSFLSYENLRDTEVLKEFRRWAGGTIEDRLVAEAGLRFRKLAGEPPSSEKELKLPDPSAVADAIVQTLHEYHEHWTACRDSRDVFMRHFVRGQSALAEARQIADASKTAAGAILSGF